MALVVQINLDDAAEAVLNRMVANEIAIALAGGVVINPTPTQFFKNFVKTYFDREAAKFDTTDRMNLATAFQKATPAEKLTIKNILTPYL